jgi:release factor glutamine methyltransferase
VTVLETIQRSTDYLAGKGVDSPRLQAEWLLAHVLQVPRLQLYLQFERGLTEAQTSLARAAVQRRGRREPLQHILGTVGFCGLELSAGAEALIPRPETELLAETALTRLKELPPGQRRFLDFGTGSGCLAIALTAHCADAVACAIDISTAALQLARNNTVRHGLVDRIRFFAGDGFAALPEAEQFSMIVSNPPYIPSGEIAALEPEVRDHDPRDALDGGADGLGFYRRIGREGREWLADDGWLFLELGDGQVEPVRALLKSYSWIVESVTDDYSGRPRVLSARCTAA